MTSFNIDSLFTNLPLQETIELCVENLFRDKTPVNNLSKDLFHELLIRTISKSLILFDQEFFKQHDGIEMSYPLETTLANVFLCYHEKFWLQNCPSEFKPVIYRRYVDDVFLLFRSQHSIVKFQKVFESSKPNSKAGSKNSYRYLTLK